MKPVCFLAILIAALSVLFERTWPHGEVFSPADLVQSFYPWAHDRGGLLGATLALDGVADSRAPWIRTFASAPDRVPGVTPVHARDLNVSEFDPGRVAIVEQHVERPAGGASVRMAAQDPDMRLIEVEGPAGGLLVLRGQFHRG